MNSGGDIVKRMKSRWPCRSGSAGHALLRDRPIVDDLQTGQELLVTASALYAAGGRPLGAKECQDAAWESSCILQAAFGLNNRALLAAVCPEA
jgi:hypothetical protein